MAKTPDFTKTLQEVMAKFPVDTSSFQDAFKSQTALGEKMAKVALAAAERSTEISSQWAKDTIARMGELTASKEEPAEYAKAVSDFASAAAEMAAEHMAAFAEVAKKVSTGMVYVNHPTKVEADLPFGGIRRSGYGRELIDLGLKEFVNHKLIGVVDIDAHF